MTTIEVSVEAGVCRIALNRPEKLNPLSAEMLESLHEAIVAAGKDDKVRCVMLTGNGRAFSSGADLSARGLDHKVDLGDTLERRYHPLVLAIQALGKPVVAAVNGICAGAACNLALACDIVLAARSASFIEIFTRIGLLPDAGGTYFLPRVIGTQRAMAASLLAEPIPAETAREWGMVWQVVDDSELAAVAGALCARLASGPTRAYAAVKRAITASGANTLEQQLAMEASLQRGLGFSADFAEGVAAFKEKRPARFSGT
jgi:2-(1,2-epoxy-1,2-dihydrophenyl)acetyl-CoA isomerase